MKVAVCLSGQPRSFRQAARSIRETFCWDSNVFVDFYIYSWDSNESYTTVSSCITLVEDPKVLQQDLEKLYSPKSIQIANEKVTYQTRLKKLKISDSGDTFQVYHLSEVLKQVPYDKYDFVFWSRIDNVFGEVINGRWHNSKLDYGQVEEILQKSEMPDTAGIIVSPFEFCFPDWVGHRAVLYDVFFGGVPKAVQRLSQNLFDIFLENAVERRYSGLYLEHLLPEAIVDLRLGYLCKPNLCGITPTPLRQVFSENLNVFSEKGFRFMSTYPELKHYPVTQEELHLLFNAFCKGVEFEVFRNGDPNIYLPLDARKEVLEKTISSLYESSSLNIRPT